MATTSTDPALSTLNTYTPSTTTATTSTNQPQSSKYTPPTYTTFPPFYTLQPNLTTRARQLDLWSTHLTTYCANHHIFRLSPTSPLFTNPSINRSLKPADIRILLDHLVTTGKVEYITKGGEQCWVYWKSLAEWADLVYGWVEETGQKGSVLTLYELREDGRQWRGMEEEFLRKVLGVLVKRGKAQVFGVEESGGVKFF